MFRSATFKLTLWYIAIVMAISIAFSFVVYHFAAAELKSGLNHQTQRWYTAFPGFDDDPFFSQHGELATSEHHILIRLVEFNAVVLVTAGIASYALARRTLTPIEAAHEQQKRFTADVSHELRTPLTAIRMESEVALMDHSATKDELRTTLQSNLEETERLEDLINNLLRLTRLEAGQLAAEFQQLALTPLIEQAVAHATKPASSKHITIVNHARDLPVYGDADSVAQLLAILIDNAVKYSPNHATVNIDSHRDNAFSVLTIKDEGIGIEPEALKHVFERFYRADKARSKQEANGYGLGLSIAKHIADIHGGTITLTSRVGHGTTATVRLPAKVPPYSTKRPVDA